MKSLMLLFQVLLDDLGSALSTRTLRDYNTVARRVELEGFSFLTITLPSFHDDFLVALDREYIGPDLFTGFRRTRGTQLPAFLRGFVDQVFDSETGRLLNDPNPDAIRAVRQACLFFSKIHLPCSDARVRKAIRGYIECEKEVREVTTRLETDWVEAREPLLDRLSDWFNALFGDLCTEWDARLYNLAYDSELRPKHGPGATADRLRGNRKWQQREWTTRLEKVMPAGEMLLPSWRSADLLDSIDFLEPGAERPVRVITVPKTLKAPRIIAIEPTAMQYAQQMLAEMLVDSMESARFPYSSMIGFNDQTPNQHLARDGSFSGELATLDLSEASDRVSNRLVKVAFARYPTLYEAVQASRSKRADVPGFGVIPLAKFASMGSALTFPIEAMIFLSVIMIGVEDALKIPAGGSQRSRRMLADDFRSSVRVYGDDMIVPTHCVQEVIRSLEAFGLKVNSRKSFWTGSFRESCGKEYWHGHDVSVVKCRQVLPSSPRNVDECISTVSLRNQLYRSGLWKTAAHLDELIEKALRGRYPVVADTSPVLGRHSFLGYQTERMHAELHSPLVKGYVVYAPLPRNPLEGEAALLKWLLKRGDEPFADDHLERSGRPEAVILKLRWASPF